jgi:mannobiose 2-epimerase
MKLMKWTALILLLLPALIGCNRGRQQQTASDPLSEEKTELAVELEKSLFQYILEPWYPRDIDSVNGGYISGFERDWKRSRGGQVKALVQQARHVWTTSFVLENYPDKQEYADYAGHGFRFLRDKMWDKASGGFHAYCSEDGTPVPESLNDKRVYGQAFAVYALSQFYLVSRNEEALELVKEQFQWMERGPHDPVYGGYFEFLNREGEPAYLDPQVGSAPRSPMSATKDYNSSIHLMEALTQLYRVWPDSLVRARLEEMFILVRDTFVHWPTMTWKTDLTAWVTSPNILPTVTMWKPLICCLKLPMSLGGARTRGPTALPKSWSIIRWPPDGTMNSEDFTMQGGRKETVLSSSMTINHGGVWWRE